MYTAPFWIQKLEKKLSWISIPNLGIYLVVLQVMGFFLVSSKPEMYGLLYLDPAAVWAGEYWRILTFLTVPVSNDLWILFFFWFFYFIMSNLEQAWGEFKLTLYFLISWVGTILVSLLLMLPVSSFLYIESTFFFALAALAPNFEILLFFVLRVKLKWMGLFSAMTVIFLPFILGSWEYKVLIAVSCANFLLFFGPGFWTKLRNQMRRRAYEKRVPKS